MKTFASAARNVFWHVASTPATRLDVLSGPHAVNAHGATSYGYILTGQAKIVAPSFSFESDAGAFFCIPGSFSFHANGLVVVIQRDNHRGLCTAGRIESSGRLSYLNGCSSTVLVPPPRRGDPVLNHLHIPAGVDQTLHSHPSFRLGIVTKGNGTARWRPRRHDQFMTTSLVAGSLFWLPEVELHSFHTGGADMDIVTFHPDSHWGPTDTDHPMLATTHI